MADEHRSDEEVLADLERSLTEQDPDRTDHFFTYGSHGGSRRRILTLAWLVWTGTWFITHLATGNPAALVLATTSAVAYPAGLGTATWWHHRPRP